MSSVLKVDNIEKYYGSKANLTKAIDRISFEVEKGEYIGIMGASGSGKTTLLNCISTIDRVTAGNILINGMDITKLKGKHLSKFRREELGFIFQDFNLLDTLTAFENIALALTIMKVPAKEIEDRVRSIAEKLMITEVLNKYPYQMSGGQKQRVAIAGVMAMRPRCIILDEPTAALDPYGRDEILSILEDLHRKKNITILLVSHSMDEVARFAQRIIVMDKGEILMDGTPADIFRRHKELEEIGLAAPQAMYIMKELKEYGLPVDTEIFTPQEAVKEINRIRDGAEQR